MSSNHVRLKLSLFCAIGFSILSGRSIAAADLFDEFPDEKPKSQCLAEFIGAYTCVKGCDSAAVGYTAVAQGGESELVFINEKSHSTKGVYLSCDTARATRTANWSEQTVTKKVYPSGMVMLHFAPAGSFWRKRQ